MSAATSWPNHGPSYSPSGAPYTPGVLGAWKSAYDVEPGTACTSTTA